MDRTIIRYALASFFFITGVVLIIFLQIELIVIDGPSPAIFYGIGIWEIIVGILIFFSERIYNMIKKSDNAIADYTN